MSDTETAPVLSRPSARGSHAAPRPPLEQQSVEWPYPTCARFCAVPHDVGAPCRTAGDNMFVGQAAPDPDSGESSFALVFVQGDEHSTVPLSAYQASVLLARLLPEG